MDRVWVCLWSEIQARDYSWKVTALQKISSCARSYGFSRIPWSSPLYKHDKAKRWAIEHGDLLISFLAFFAYLRTEEAPLDVHLEACWALQGGWLRAAARYTHLIDNKCGHVCTAQHWRALFRKLRMRRSSSLVDEAGVRWVHVVEICLNPSRVMNILLNLLYIYCAL